MTLNATLNLLGLSFSVFKLMIIIALPIKIRNMTSLYYLDSMSLCLNAYSRVTLLRFKYFFVYWNDRLK